MTDTSETRRGCCPDASLNRRMGLHSTIAAARTRSQRVNDMGNEVPTPTCNSLSHVLSGMFHSTSDKIAWAAAGVAGGSPLLLRDQIQHINEFALFIGPTLAGIFLTFKIVLVGSQIVGEWINIWKAWWRDEKPKH